VLQNILGEVAGTLRQAAPLQLCQCHSRQGRDDVVLGRKRG
jgi:hypothetical protein